MNELNLSNLLGILKKCIVYIILVGFLFAVGAYCYCKFIAVPTYQAKISFIGVNSSNFAAQTGEEEGDIKTADISASRQLILTYVDIFKTTEFFSNIQKKSGLDYSSGQIKGMTSIAQRNEQSLFIDVTVTCANPDHAIAIAETIYAYGGEYLEGFFPNAYVKAVENTNSRAVRNYPRTLSTMVTSAFLGGVLVFVLAITINLLDKTIKGEKDFSANYDIPILGNIPNFKAAAREETK